MTTFISFIIVLGILIFIHELGHFAVAKLSGVGVEKFSLGFGPRLFGIRKGETEYRVSILPLGGYVKMVGEAPGEEISEADKARSFTHKPVHKRVAIVAAGPIMNLVLAALLLPVIFLLGISVPAYLEKPAEVGYVAPDGAAAKAGLLKGDVISAVNGKAAMNWEEVLSAMALSPGRPLDLTLSRRGAEVKAVVTPEASKETGAGHAGIFPRMDPVIADLTGGYPAKEAGLMPGDVIVAVDGREITHWAELEEAIHKNGSEKTFTVLRGGERLSYKITPRHNPDANVYLIGITRKEDQVFRRYGLTDAIVKGIGSGVEMTGRLFVVIKGLVTGQYSLKTLGGPIMIAQVAGKAAESGLSDLLSLVAFLSLQLGIINLFPMPVLDGGHLLFFGIEAIKGKPLSERFMAVAQQVGVALLILLMVLVTYNDLFRIFG